MNKSRNRISEKANKLICDIHQLERNIQSIKQDYAKTRKRIKRAYHAYIAPRKIRLKELKKEWDNFKRDKYLNVTGSIQKKGRCDV